MAQKTYTSQDFVDKYNALKCKEKTKVLYDALDYMQEYNGRSKLDCVILAMGYKVHNEDEDTYTKRSE